MSWKEKNNRLLICKVMMLLLLFGAAALWSWQIKEQPEAAPKLRIGAPTDTGGLLIDYLIRTKGLERAEIVQSGEIVALNDCCSSSAQWALSGEALDAALLCPDAAEALLAKDDRYEVLGPCLLNADCIVVRPGVAPQKIAVMQNRAYQVEAVQERFGASCATYAMLPVGIPYALEKGLIDGGVVDALSSLRLSGNKLPLSAQTDQVSYVLVVSRQFKARPQFDEFITLFSQAAQELNTPETLKAAVQNYKQIDVKQEDVETWNRLRMKFSCEISVGRK